MDLILDIIKNELNISEDKLQKMKDIMRKSSLDDLERTYDSFCRFGVLEIFENIK